MELTSPYLTGSRKLPKMIGVSCRRYFAILAVADEGATTIRGLRLAT